jgi:hypothetical protein
MVLTAPHASSHRYRLTKTPYREMFTCSCCLSLLRIRDLYALVEEGLICPY